VTDQAEKELVEREWDRHEELMKKQNQETGSENTGENTGGDGGGEAGSPGAGSPAAKAGPNATAIYSKFRGQLQIQWSHGDCDLPQSKREIELKRTY